MTVHVKRGARVILPVNWNETATNLTGALLEPISLKVKTVTVIEHVGRLSGAPRWWCNGIEHGNADGTVILIEQHLYGWSHISEEYCHYQSWMNAWVKEAIQVNNYLKLASGFESWANKLMYTGVMKWISEVVHWHKNWKNKFFEKDEHLSLLSRWWMNKDWKLRGIWCWQRKFRDQLCRNGGRLCFATLDIIFVQCYSWVSTKVDWMNECKSAELCWHYTWEWNEHSLNANGNQPSLKRVMVEVHSPMHKPGTKFQVCNSWSGGGMLSRITSSTIVVVSWLMSKAKFVIDEAVQNDPSWWQIWYCDTKRTQVENTKTNSSQVQGNMFFAPSVIFYGAEVNMKQEWCTVFKQGTSDDHSAMHAHFCMRCQYWSEDTD